MPSNDAWKRIVRTLLDAFDVDIQLWMGRSLATLRETTLGSSFAEWAEANPIMFETLLRAASALVQKLPKDNNLLIETLSSQLARLPVEVRRALKADTAAFATAGQKGEEFQRKYEEAIKDLPEQDVAIVVQLPPHHLKEWVYSPARVRPHLVKKWAEQDARRREQSERVLIGLKQFIQDLDQKARSAVPAAGRITTRLQNIKGAKR